MLEKAPVGGTVWGKPGPALLIPKPGPVERGMELRQRCGRKAGEQFFLNPSKMGK